MAKTVWIINQYAVTPENGYAGRSFYIGRELARMGHNVVVIAASAHHLLRESQSFPDRFTKRSLHGIDFVYVRVPDYTHAHSKQRAFNWFRFAYALLGLDSFLGQRPDAIISSSPSLVSWLGAERLARRHNARLVFEARDIWPLTLQELGGYSALHPFMLLLRWIERRAYRHSDLTLSPIPHADEHMLASGLSGPDKFHWVPNGVDVEEFEAAVEVPASVQAAIPKDRFTIGYAGRLGEANALDNLIEAAKLLASDHSVHFVIVGDGRKKEQLTTEIEANGISNVTFIDSIKKTQVAALLRSFDACFIGARRSSLYRFGVAMNKIPEYMMSARPIIYAIDSGKYDPITDAECGVVVAPDDPTALAQAIQKLAQTTAAERHAMGQRGKEFALSNFDYSKIAANLNARLL